MRFREIEKIVLNDGWELVDVRGYITNTNTQPKREKLQSQIIEATFLKGLSTPYSNRRVSNETCHPLKKGALS